MVSTKYKVDIKEKEKWTTPLQGWRRSTKKSGRHGMSWFTDSPFERMMVQKSEGRSLVWESASEN